MSTLTATPRAIAAPVSTTATTTQTYQTTDMARWQLAGYWGLISVGLFWNSKAKNDLVIMDMITLEAVLHGLAFAGLFMMMLRARIAGRDAAMNLQVTAALLLAGGFAVLEQKLQPTMYMQESFANLYANLLGVCMAYLVSVAPSGKVRMPALMTWASRILLVIAMPPMVWLATTEAGRDLMVRVSRMGTDASKFDDKCHFYGAAVIVILIIIACPLSRRHGRASVAVAILGMIAMAPCLEWVQLATGRGLELNDMIMHMQGLSITVFIWTGVIGLINLVAPARHLLTPAETETSQDTRTETQTHEPGILRFEAPSKQPLRQAA